MDAKQMDGFAFNPISLNYWRRLFKIAGWPLIGILILLFGGKSFDNSDSAGIILGKIGEAGYLRGVALAAAFLVIILNLKKIRLPKHIASHSLITYIFVGLLSVLWSSAPIASLGKGLELLAGLLLVMIFANGRSAQLRIQAAVSAVMGLIAIELFIVLIGFVTGIDGFVHACAGGFSEVFGKCSGAPFISTNSVGYFSVLLISYQIAQRLESSARLSAVEISFFTMALATLVFSSSRTSLALLLLFLAFLAIKRGGVALVITVFVSVLGAASSADYLFSFIQGETADANLMTLSGRTVLWEGAFEYFKESPLVGYGFGIGSRDFFYNWGLEGFDEAISTVHNGILEVLLGIGILGFVPWLIAIGCAIRNWRREFFGASNQYSSVVSALPVLLGCTVMSVGVGGAQGEMFILFCLICYFRRSRSDMRGALSQ